MKKITVILLFIVSAFATRANNIQLANVSLGPQNTGSQFSMINFDVSWENSWRTITNEINYDGAWIFVKFRKKTSSLWQHATLNFTGNTTPAASVLQVSLDGKGLWIYHTVPGSDFTGNVNYTGAGVRWNYGADGVLNTDSVEIRVFALEMVYVPQGAFKLGSGSTETNHFEDGTSGNPYNVTSEGAIAVTNTAGNLHYSSANGLGGDIAGPIPANFPKGFGAFWLMKYECSQQQYVDFVNNLDLTRANNRYTGVFTGTHPNLVAPFPERAMNLLSELDGLAFSDWAGLRPFTELEFEKTCRGYNQLPVPNEYPWGNTTISATTATTASGTATETANNGNANYGNSLGVATRTGIYATGSSSRQTSGGAYYGVMDMAGNIAEVCVSVGGANGRSFTNVNGDGNLDVNGDANVATWPSIATGFSRRGGYFADGAAQLATSDRYYGSANVTPGNRYVYNDIRLARTAE